MKILSESTLKEQNAEEAEYTENVQAIEEGIASFERGEGRPAKEALEELVRKHRIKDLEEKELIATGLMRLPQEEKTMIF